MKLAMVLLVFGSIVTLGAGIFLIMSLFAYDPSAIYFIVGSIIVMLNGLIAVGVGAILRELYTKNLV